MGQFQTFSVTFGRTWKFRPWAKILYWDLKNGKESKFILARKTHQNMPKSVPNKFLTVLVITRWSESISTTHGVLARPPLFWPFLTHTCLEPRKSHFWGASKMWMQLRLWAENWHPGLKTCVKHDFATENCTSSLLQVVQDALNRRKQILWYAQTINYSDSLNRHVISLVSEGSLKVVFKGYRRVDYVIENPFTLLD